MVKKCLPKVSCVILAGGRSQRMGEDKAFIEVAGRPLIAWTLERLTGLGKETIIVTNTPERFCRFDAKVVTDVIPGVGALGGLHSGLFHASCSHALVVACDMPFLNRLLLRYQVVLANNYDVVVPRIGEYLEPLHAVYARACLPFIKERIDAGCKRIYDFYHLVRVRFVENAEIAMFDPEHHSFLNVNTPAELQAVRALAMEICAKG